MENTQQRKRYISLLLFMVAIAIGLGSRKFAVHLPKWNQLYFGDAVWAFMVYYLFASMLVRKPAKTIMYIALAFSFFIEFSQLYQAEWINALRTNRLLVLVLGRGFLWSDLVAYTVGIVIAFGIDYRLLRPKK